MTSRPSIAANIANANRQGKRNGTTSALVPSNGGVIDNGHRYFRVPPSTDYAGCSSRSRRGRRFDKLNSRPVMNRLNSLSA